MFAYCFQVWKVLVKYNSLLFCGSKTGHLYLAGKSVGIEFTGKCKRFPNTILGHTMLEYAKSLDPTRRIQNEAAERIFQVSSVMKYGFDKTRSGKILQCVSTYVHNFNNF